MNAETNVNLPALIRQAHEWDRQSEVMGAAASEAPTTMPSAAASELGEASLALSIPLGPFGLAGSGLALGDYPLFQAVISAYETACPQLAALAKQGEHQMSQMATGLIRAVEQYMANENGIIHASHHAVH